MKPHLALWAFTRADEAVSIGSAGGWSRPLGTQERGAHCTPAPSTPRTRRRASRTGRGAAAQGLPEPRGPHHGTLRATTYHQEVVKQEDLSLVQPELLGLVRVRNLKESTVAHQPPVGQREHLSGEGVRSAPGPPAPRPPACRAAAWGPPAAAAHSVRTDAPVPAVCQEPSRRAVGSAPASPAPPFLPVRQVPDFLEHHAPAEAPQRGGHDS